MLEILNDPHAHATRLRPFDYRLQWTPEEHIPAGSLFELQIHTRRAGVAWKFMASSMESADLLIRRPQDARINFGPMIFRARLLEKTALYRSFTISLVAIPPPYAGVNPTLSVWIAQRKNSSQDWPENPEFVQEKNSFCTLHLGASSVDRLELYLRPAKEKNGMVRLVIAPEDRFGNPAVFKKKVSIELRFGKEVKKISLQNALEWMVPPHPGLVEARCALSDLDSSENLSNARYESGMAVITSNPMPKEREGLIPCFGDIHWHTQMSGDGDRSLDEAYAFARDGINLDFAASSDHGPDETQWRETVEVAEKYNREGSFATLFGWEHSTSLGHHNYYFLDPNHPLVNGGKAGIQDGGSFAAYRDLLAKQNNFIGIPHHVNATSGTRSSVDQAPKWQQYSYDSQHPDFRLIEIMQVRGNQERNRYQDEWRGWHQDRHSSVQDALAFGWVIGFTGGTDNHVGYPGRAWDPSELAWGAHPHVKSMIMTGVWTRERTRDGIFEAIKNRHTWAVWDTRAVAYFTVNKALMGSFLKIRKGTKLFGSLQIDAEAPFQAIEVISEKNVIWRGASDHPSCELNMDLGQAAHSTHFYVRALLRTGGLIYISPVYVQIEP